MENQWKNPQALSSKRPIMPVEKTLVILKPDCTRKNLIGEVIAMIEAEGFSIQAAKMLMARRETLVEHYEGVGQLLTRFKTDKSEEVANSIFESVISFMQSERVMPMIVEGENAIKAIRALAGATRPREAEEGTIRATFGAKDPNGPIENVIHASANAEEAAQEIKVWFPEL